MEMKLSTPKIDDEFIQTILDNYIDPIGLDIFINSKKYSEIEDKIYWPFVLDRSDLDYIQKRTQFGNYVKVCLTISDKIPYDEPVKCIVTEE